jgi:uncharacterized protein (TIGR00730 family)
VPGTGVDGGALTALGAPAALGLLEASFAPVGDDVCNALRAWPDTRAALTRAQRNGAQQFVGTVIGGRIERHGVVKDPLRFLFLEIRPLGEQRKIGKGESEQLVARAQDDNAALSASTALENSKHYESAREFGHLVAMYNKIQSDPHNRLHICTGGGPGIMEAANRGAFESGDLTIGLNISLPREQSPNPYITPGLAFRFHYFALRKMHFVMRARAIVVYPGGFGSFDELFEVLTLIQTKKIEPLPVILVDAEHWRTVVRFDLLVNQELIDVDDLKIIHFVDTATDAWSIIRDWYELG